MLLSELVCEQEALQFQLVSEGLQAHVTYDSTVFGHSLLTDAVQEAADAALGSGAKAFIDGSIAKGTQWRGSDIDMLVQTGEPLTRSQVESLTEELKKSPMFNPSINRQANIVDEDEDGDEDESLTEGLEKSPMFNPRGPTPGPMFNPGPYVPALPGQSPTPGPIFNPRMLKVMASHALLPVQVKNYHLELLTLLCQEAAAARGGAHVADGSMQLVVDVLQAIADDRMPTAVAAENENDLTKDEFASLVTKLKVTLVYGQPRPGPFQRDFSSNHIAIVTGMSVVMEDLALVVPHLLDNDTYHCIFLTDQAQLRACGCVFSSPTSPCIALNDSGTRCSLADCCFGPDKERAASAGVIVDNSACLKAERCQFLRCSEAAVEVRAAGSKAQLKACTFTKCKKQAVVLYSGGEELVMEDCVIENCGAGVMNGLVQVACGKARLRKCSLVNNKTDGVVVQSESRQNTPVLDMSDCKLTGNSTGVLFGFGIGGGGGGSGVLDSNVITNNATVGLVINEVAPDQVVHLSGNVFRSNGSTLFGQVDVQMFQNVKDQVVMKNNRATIRCSPISALDAVNFARGLKLSK
eukprot:gene7493-639_t